MTSRKYVSLPAAIVPPILSPSPLCLLPPASCPLCLSSGYAVLKKVKDSRCGTPLLLSQLPHQCIILPNLTSLPTQSFSLPAVLTPSPTPTRFFLFFFISFLHPSSPVRLHGSPITAAEGTKLKLLPQAVSCMPPACMETDMTQGVLP